MVINVNPTRTFLMSAAVLMLAACGGNDQESAATDAAEAAKQGPAATGESETAAADATGNPFYQVSTLQFQMPQFDLIKDEHFVPAMERGMEEHLVEIEQIANNPEPATFDNTIVAMERSGQLLGRVTTVFFSLTGADTNDQREAIQRQMSPKLSGHRDAIQLNPKLFARIDKLYQTRATLGLDAEQQRLLEESHRDFVRAGAQLTEQQKVRLREINTELAKLGTTFSQNVLKEVNASAQVLDSPEQLAGGTDAQIEGAADAAKERDLQGKYVLPLMNYSSQPQLAWLADRATREQLMQASLTRGSRGNEFDNRQNVADIVALRTEKANMLGYDTYADYSLEVTTAKTVAAASGMLAKLAPVAVANARKEGAVLQEMINATEAKPFQLQSWDWPYYTEKVRQQKYDFDESEIKPYFEMNSVLTNGVFFAAEKLFGITFKERPDLPVYHPDVRVFEVFDHDGEAMAIFLADFYARPSKRGGAWMNAYVSQSGLMGTSPVVANHLNIPKPPEGEPTLLTMDEVTTMFHEFGHALHGMFSDVKYPSFSGTSVPRDFVEYPSQVNEMWATWPVILEHYALHYKTGERIPQALLDKVIEAAKFNEGYRTTEYLAASVLDMCYYTRTADQLPSGDDILAFEGKCLNDAGFDYAPVPTRYRSTYFSHSMGGYAAGYYSYIWSEVLDAESVKWMHEHGGLERANGDHFRATLLSQGGTKDAMQLFRDFAGKDPDIQPLLERRGLIIKE
jgi:peptidyl-dipeptidase Dcp